MSENNLYVGIDPGKTGGIAAIHSSDMGGSVAMPLTEQGDCDVLAIQQFLLELCSLFTVPNFSVYVVIEVQQRGKSIAMQEGRLTALIDLLEVHRLSVRPQEWQKEIFSRIVADIPKDIDTKEASILFCQENEIELPTLNPTGTKLHDGIADAFCMAVYCRHLVENM